MVLGKLDKYISKNEKERMKLEHFLIACTKINPKYIKDINKRPESRGVFSNRKMDEL